MRAIGCTATPSKRALGILAARLLRIRSNAARTSASFARFSSTPPTSLLWLISGESTFSTTGKPAFADALAAASALAATSISLRTARPLDRADAIIDEIIESLTFVAYSRAQEIFEPAARTGT